MRGGVFPALILAGVFTSSWTGCSEEPAATSTAPPYPPPFVGARTGSARPNVVLISLDTLSARHLGLYGYPRSTSPHLDAYARDATVFLEAYSTAPKTAESHMSMFTSLYPTVHGVRTRLDEAKLTSLDPDARTFVQILKAEGFTTVGFHDGGFVRAQLGFARGFDVYEQASQDRAIAWLEANGQDQPFFLFHHTYWVHDPYLPRPPEDLRFTDPDYSGPIVHSRAELAKLTSGDDWAAQHKAFWSRVDKEDFEEVEHVIALYDTLIAQLDESLAVLLETIDRIAPNTVVIILADHGEEFGQHGKFLHQQIYGETTHVPLIIRHPDVGHGLEVRQRVSLIDLAPTILDLLGIAAIDQFQGRSLANHLVGDGASRPVFIEFGRRRALIDGGRKLLSQRDGDELYDLAADPGEQHDLLGAGFLRRLRKRLWGDYRALRGKLRAIRSANSAQKEALELSTGGEQLGSEAIEQLQALGYVE